MADTHGLSAHYEAVRRAVVDPSEHNPPMQARALLMRKGLAAWMRSIEAASPLAAAPNVACVERRLPGGIESHLVEILATMALATTREVVP